MIRVENLRKSFNGTVAVDGISLEVNASETFGLLGPNGAGKTTTVNMIIGLLKPDSGKVVINGTGDPTNPQIRLDIGNCPQSLSIYEDMSAEENLRFFGKMYGLKGMELSKKVDWALEFAGLTDRRSDLSRDYSGGMKRRLNLVAAMIHDPTVLILDEPTVGVDPQSRNLIFEGIEAMKREGKTVIYTTHYMEEAERLCDRVAIIDHGVILDLDTVESLIEKHGGVSVIEGDLISPPDNPETVPGMVEGTKVRIETDRPMEEFAALSGKGLKFSSVRIDKADLEAVFLNLTGRRLRD